MIHDPLQFKKPPHQNVRLHHLAKLSHVFFFEGPVGSKSNERADPSERYPLPESALIFEGRGIALGNERSGT
jgi:hypothetical protein